MADEFKSPTDEYQFHLVRAEHHLKKALDLLHERGEPKRSLRCQMLIARAREITARVYANEPKEKK